MAVVTVQANFVSGGDEETRLARLVSQAIADASGKPEPLVMTSVEGCAVAGEDPTQMCVWVTVEIIGQEDPFRTEKMVKYLTYKLVSAYPGLLPAQVMLRSASFSRTDLGYNGSTF